MGSTAMDVIDTILADSDEPMLLTRWMRIQNEEKTQRIYGTIL